MNSTKQTNSILADIRVIDLTAVVFGPLATQMLGDMGADVIKVEPPAGDMLRAVEPARNPGMGAAFLGCNRNKRSLVLDLKTEPGRSALYEILKSADIFIHSMRPQALEKLGLTATKLQAINPALIYVSAMGFGSGGPYSDKPAYDDIVQSVSGMADLARMRDPDNGPDYAPTILADKLGGVTAAHAIMAALFHRERTGEAQIVEVPMFETLASFLLVEHLAAATFEEKPETFGYNRMLVPHRRPLKTADGYITILPYTNRQWRSFFTITGRDDMLDDPRITDMAERSRNIGDLYEIVSEMSPKYSTSKWLEMMEQADVPAAAAQRLDQLPDDPHLVATNFFVKSVHPSEGEIWTTAPSVKYSSSPTNALHKPAPRLGQHSREILREAGFNPAEINRIIGPDGT